MNEFPPIGTDDIRAWVGERSYGRGHSYAESGAIFQARRTGTTLKARCEGSQANSYRVEVNFDDRGIAEADCSCPVGAGGHCKHVAALLLTWMERPDDFIAVPDVETALEGRSKEELIALVKQMLRRQPELEVLLETPLPTPGKRQTPLNPEIYRRQAAALFQHTEYEWGMEADVADQLFALTAIGDGFAEQADYASATTVYEAVSAETLENYGLFHDENGELATVVQACVEGLGRCLEGAADDATTREATLRALFAVYRSDVELGGLGLGDEVPGLILQHATPEERRTVAEWVRNALPSGTDWSSDYHRQVYGGFLLDLEEDTLDDEAYLRVCRETGRIGDVVDRLLERGRVDEATEEAKQAGDYVLLGLADLFVKHEHGDVAERLMLERSGTTQDMRLLEWLKDRYKARGDRAAALDLARKLFRARPSLEGYQEIRELATPSDRWESLRPSLRMFLKETNRTDLLIEVYLDEGEIDHAIEAVQARKKGGVFYGYYGEPLALKVAKAAEKKRPQAALDLYRQHVERLIDARGRENYQAACNVLIKVRALYEGMGDAQGWESYIADLRERNRALRALKEELASVGL